MKKSDNSGKQKSKTSNSSTGAKTKKKAQKKSIDKRKKRLSEEEMEDLCGELKERRKDLEFYRCRAGLKKKALLGDTTALSELTGEFIGEFMEVIRKIFFTRIAARNKKTFRLMTGRRNLANFAFIATASAMIGVHLFSHVMQSLHETFTQHAR